MSALEDFKTGLETLKKAERYRSLNLADGLDLTSNDYLGMAQEPFLRKCAIQALENGLDIGAAGSRLLRGHTKSHANLEEFAANHFNAPKTLYFSSGFQANYAILMTLPSRHDVILYDSLIHASMRDGIQASKAKGFKFAHNDLNQLEDRLKKHSNSKQLCWICVESLYSMDGDFAPLDNIVELAKDYNFVLIVDEAHSTGIYGPHGKGLSQKLIEKLGHERIITVHTCGKAIGVAGGLICASDFMIQTLINKARPFIYSTAPMPLQAYLVQKSLGFLSGNEGDIRRTKLFELCERAKALFGEAGSQIVPIILGEDAKTLEIAKKLREKGYDIRAIRPPTVPESSARLRLSLSSYLLVEQLNSFADDFKKLT